MATQLLVDQVAILETMTPLDFMEFRDYSRGMLSTASGFQSLQFRLIENKLGVREEDRVSYARGCTEAVGSQGSSQLLDSSIAEPSLCDLVQRWLERTPGLETNEFNFWGKYSRVVQALLRAMERQAQAEPEPMKRRACLEAFKRKQVTLTLHTQPNCHQLLCLTVLLRYHPQ
ncbi:TDO2 [Cordylochernes scorpioides]|uniref:TDO2 n=1 Tax=Cordylochernes scorpioides TaxID=51811 RepID=A0ABY6L569_9ARAC|nr:TDO2 [Cordylochernes scorpioides]